MRRVSGIAATFLVAIGATIWVAERRVGDAALALGRDLYSHRPNLAAAIVRDDSRRSLVVWLGDSTIVGWARPSYPQLIGASVGRSGRVESRVVALPGLDAFHFYFLMGPVLDLRPDVVVLLAHLRMFNPSAGQPFNDLAALIPAAELPRTAMLPLHARGLTLPGLLLTRVLRQPAAERCLYFFEGTRTMFQEAAFFDALGPTEPPPVARMRNFTRLARQTLAAYDVSISPRHPTVRMLGAAVDMAVRHGVRTLVVVSPVPHEDLARQGWYAPDVYRERVAVLRATVERNGGALVDVHDALARAEFADHSGHYTPAGAEHVAAILEPVIRDVARGVDAREAARSLALTATVAVPAR